MVFLPYQVKTYLNVYLKPNHAFTLLDFTRHSRVDKRPNLHLTVCFLFFCQPYMMVQPTARVYCRNIYVNICLEM